MSSRSVEAILYRDLEKIHRVIGYYEGQEIKPLETHEKFIQKSLDAHLRDPENYIRRIQYELNMTEVTSANSVIFRSESAETSLVYTLFSEGIKSLIFVRDLSATEMKDWGLLIRKTLEDFDRGGRDDLASVLWRSPFRNLRTRIYNSLFDLVESQKPSVALDENKLDGSWHFRDQEWDLPDASSVQRESFESASFDEDMVSRMRSQLGKLDISESNENPFRISHPDLTVLAEELSSYDQNQVDFNLLLSNFELLQHHEQISNDSFEETKASILHLTEMVLNRFQPSLIDLLLDQIQIMQFSEAPKLSEEIKSMISSCLATRSNERKLLDSLRDPERADISKRLLPLLRYEQFPAIIDFYLATEDRDGLVDFFKILINRKINFEKVCFSWGEDRLSEVLPYFRRLDWPNKYRVLERAVKSPSIKVRKQASYYLPNIKMAAESAIELYGQLTDEIREVWQRAFLEQENKEHWRSFFVNFFQSKAWMKSESPIVGNRLMMGWVEVALKYLGPVGVNMMLPWVQARRFILWARYPQAREAILNAMLACKEPELRKLIQPIMRREAGLKFQPEEMKNRLGAFRV